MYENVNGGNSRHGVSLAHHGNPQVKRLLEEVQSTRTESLATRGLESVSQLRTALQRLNEATTVDHDLQQLRPMHESLGLALTETPWLESSSVISGKVKALRQQHVQILSLLDQGETIRARDALAELLNQLGQLQKGNVLAMNIFAARSGWLQASQRIPDRLKDDPSLAAIRDRGRDAENGWDAGDWTNVSTLYHRATERLGDYLEGQLTSEEKSQHQASSTDHDDAVKLKSEVTRLQREQESLSGQTNRKLVHAEHVQQIRGKRRATYGVHQLDRCQCVLRVAVVSRIGRHLSLADRGRIGIRDPSRHIDRPLLGR